MIPFNIEKGSCACISLTKVKKKYSTLLFKNLVFEERIQLSILSSGQEKKNDLLKVKKKLEKNAHRTYKLFPSCPSRSIPPLLAFFLLFLGPFIDPYLNLRYYFCSLPPAGKGGHFQTKHRHAGLVKRKGHGEKGESGGGIWTKATLVNQLVAGKEQEDDDEDKEKEKEKEEEEE